VPGFKTASSVFLISRTSKYGLSIFLQHVTFPSDEFIVAIAPIVFFGFVHHYAFVGTGQKEFCICIGIIK